MMFLTIKTDLQEIIIPLVHSLTVIERVLRKIALQLEIREIIPIQEKIKSVLRLLSVTDRAETVEAALEAVALITVLREVLREALVVATVLQEALWAVAAEEIVPLEVPREAVAAVVLLPSQDLAVVEVEEGTSSN